MSNRLLPQIKKLEPTPNNTPPNECDDCVVQQLEDQTHFMLESAIQDFRVHTKTLKRSLLSIAIMLALCVIVVLVLTIFKTLSGGAALGSGTTLLGLLTFTTSQFDKLRACEFECSMLKVQFAVGGKRALSKALSSSSCKYISKMHLKSGEQEK